ncbi:uncharacterized protein CCR75_000651 [Bremia lactucae]|uniref:Bifunctional lysine-specific demethylase and histidyl-hydroxylase n=1 Tax=Bremia lactucae TaxID=4779 RepID=A0A976IB40_BRELC|nr:hypothetical protein CCR75_000651 [Bremia lactucae]
MSRTKKSSRVKRNADADLAELSKKQRTNKSDLANAAPTATEVDQKGSRQWAKSTFTKLLGGMSMDMFLSDYFEKKPLHVRKEEKGQLFNSNLFSRKKMLKIMEKQSDPFSFGKDLAICKYVDSKRENFHDEACNGQASSRQVARLLDSGYSCQFYQPQRYADGLYELNAALEEAFGGLAGASAYLTPANAQALAPHHDDVEVFVLQTQGRKRWKLYRPLVELAGEHSLDLTEDQIGEPWMEITVEEGDLLYFPRGVIHQACTDENEFSTHVTISVYQHTSWANFLEVALPRIIRQAFDSNVEFRKGLPVGYLNYMGTQFVADTVKATEFTATCKKLVGKLAAYVIEKDLQEAADEAAMDVLANRLPPLGENQSKEDDEFSRSLLDSNFNVHFKNRSHVRLTMGEDALQEAFVAVYFSLYNCRRHHMGLCTCDGEYEDERSKTDDDDEKSDEEESEEAGIDDGYEVDEDVTKAMRQIPPQPKSVVFPGDLAPALMKLYASSGAAPWVSINKLAEVAGDETAVRGMVLRLWSEGLIEITSQSC